MAAPRVHLIAGSTGAGKTTYARALAEQVGGVRFSIDEWMTALFWMDSAQPPDPAWAMARVERCYAQIWATAADVAARGVAVILDLGFTTRASRERFVGLARTVGLMPRLHFVDVPADERWRRVEARNAAGSDQLAFAVDRAMFDYVEGLFEAPDAAEMAAADGVRTTPAADSAG